MSFSSKRSRRARNTHTHEGEQQKPSFFSKTKSSDSQSGTAFFQPKLSIGKPNDAFEQEADSMADQVVSQSNNPEVQQKEEASIQRMGAEEEEAVQTKPELMKMEEEEAAQTKPELMKMEEEEAAQTKPEIMKIEEEETAQPKAEIMKMGEEEEVQTKPDGSGQASSGLSQQIKSSQGKGQKLPGSTQKEMSSAFGYDFSEVNIHTDDESAAMNKELGAQAFTHCKDVYFNEGKFNPESSSGKHLLAHELTHVVQQNKKSE